MKIEKRKHLTAWQTPAIVLERKLDSCRFNRFFCLSSTFQTHFVQLILRPSSYFHHNNHVTPLICSNSILTPVTIKIAWNANIIHYSLLLMMDIQNTNTKICLGTWPLFISTSLLVPIIVQLLFEKSYSW